MLRLSTTKLNEAAQCLKKYDYHANLKLVPKPRNVKIALRRGIWIHACLEVESKGGDWRARLGELQDWALENNLDEEEIGQVTREVQAVMQGYDFYWRRFPDLKITPMFTERELEFQVPQLDLTLTATVDLVGTYRGGTALVEYKSTSHIPPASWRAIDPQTAVQYLACRQNGIQVDRIVFDYLLTVPPPIPQAVKTGKFSTRKITTTTAAFEQGIKDLDAIWSKENRDDYQDYVDEQRALLVSDEKFYQRYEVLRPERYLKQTAQDIAQIVRLIRDCESRSRWPHSFHPVICTRMCQYSELCALEYMAGGRPSLMRDEEFMRDDGSREGRLDPLSASLLFSGREEEEF